MKRFISNRFWTVLFSNLLGLWFVCCGGSSPDSDIARITLEPDTLSIAVSQSATLTATAFDQENRQLPDVSLVWSSSNTAVVVVNEEGTVTGIAEGSAVIAASSQGVTGTANIEVTSETEQFSLSVTIVGDGSVTSTPSGIDCPGSCSVDFDSGTQVTLTAVPSNGQVFHSWSGDCTGSGPCTITMDGHHSVTAAFEPSANEQPLTITVVGDGAVTSDPPGIDCVPTCSAMFTQGTQVALTPSPGIGYEFTGWSGDCSGTDSCLVTMDAPRSVTAIFEEIQNPQSLTVNTVGNGTVTSEPSGISCLPTCSAYFEHGTQVTLTAISDVDNQFVGWSGDCSGTGECVLTMDAPHNVVASFEPIQYSQELNVSVVGDGSVTSDPAGIDCGETCTASFTEGTQVTLTATPGVNQYFAGWSGDCSGTGQCVVWMNVPVNVTATFQTVQYWLTVSKGGNGTIISTPAGIDCGNTCSAAFDAGTDVSLDAIPDPGWKFLGWGNDCSGTDACDLSMTDNRFVSAGFEGPFDFTVSVDSAQGIVSMLQGESMSTDVSVTLTWGAALPVDLSIEGLPGGVVADFSEQVVNPDGSSLMTLTADSTATLGEHAVTITGQSGTTVRQAQFTLQVRSPRELINPIDIAIESGGATALVTENTWSGQQGRLVRMDVSSREVIKTISYHLRAPRGLAIESDGATALVAHADGLARVDLTAGTTTPVTFDLNTPHGVALESSGNTALVADCGETSCDSTGRLARVDLTDGTVTDITSPGQGLHTPTGVALEPDGTRALVIESGTGQLLRVTLDSGITVVSATGFYFPGNAGKPVIEEGGETVLVASQAAWDLPMYRVDLATGTKTEIAAFGPCCDPSRPNGFALEAGGDSVLVVDQNFGRVIRQDLSRPIATLAPARQSIEVLYNPRGIALEAGDNTALVVDCGAGDCDVTGRLARVDLTNGLVTPISLSAGGLVSPRGITIEPGGTSALISEKNAGRILRVDLTNGDTSVVATNFYFSAWGGDIAVEAGGATALVADNSAWNFPLYRVDLTTGDKTSITDLGSCCEGPENANIAIEPGGASVLVLSAAFGTIRRVDLSSGVITTVASGLTGPVGLRLEPDATTALVTENHWTGIKRLVRVDLNTGKFTVLLSALGEPQLLAISTDGSSAFITEGNRVQRVDLSNAYDLTATTQGLERPSGVAVESGGATALVLDCGDNPVGQECANAGRLVRADLSNGTIQLVTTGLNNPIGLAIEESGDALVTDCGPSGTFDCQNSGRLLRVDGVGNKTLIASNLNTPEGIWIGPGGASALVTERAAGRLLQVDLGTGGFAIVAAGLNQPTQVFGESGGETALVSILDGIMRVTLATGDATRLVTWNLRRFAVEPGETTALMVGADIGLFSSLARVDLTSGALDILRSGMFDNASTVVVEPSGTSALVTSEFWDSGALLRFSIP
jgi:sugar lactone lactonase YvrE